MPALALHHKGFLALKGDAVGMDTLGRHALSDEPRTILPVGDLSQCVLAGFFECLILRACLELKNDAGVVCGATGNEGHIEAAKAAFPIALHEIPPSKVYNESQHKAVIKGLCSSSSRVKVAERLVGYIGQVRVHGLGVTFKHGTAKLAIWPLELREPAADSPLKHAQGLEVCDCQGAIVVPTVLEVGALEVSAGKQQAPHGIGALGKLREYDLLINGPGDGATVQKGAEILLQRFVPLCDA